jgi:regulator of nucleoside diphosphate kinase
MNKKRTISVEDFNSISPELQNMIYSDYENEELRNFADALENAKQINDKKSLSEFITLDSEIELQDTENQNVLRKRLVIPPASYDLQELSVFTPVGMAVLGRKVGDIVECKVPAGKRIFEIKNKIDSNTKAGFM